MADEHDEEAPPQRPFDIESALNSLIARNNNDARMALRTLSEDNYQYRRTIRALKTKIKDLEKRPEMKADEKIVSAEQFKLLSEFETLKLKPEDVKTALTERDTFKAQEAERKKAEHIAKGAKPLKLNPEVLADLIESRKLQFGMQDVEVDDPDAEEEGAKKSVKVLHLRKKEEDAWVPADKFAQRELKGYLPALLVKDENSDESEDDERVVVSNREPEGQPRPRPFPRQASGTGSKAPRNSTDVADKHIQGRYVTPSKLRETQNN